MEKKDKSLAMFITEAREKIGLSSLLLAKRANLSEEQIQDIESGKDLFLSSTVRQKLAKALKLNPSEIKAYEKTVDIHYGGNVPKDFEDYARMKMTLGETDDLRCPVCGSEMVFRTVKRYDLEDNLILHHKASCKKCPYQII
ncbi:MAG: helix-turn-helix domain-containing protein [Candidatus Gastranaerophilales bacterium]|nr:helix-turn-helix domain-containing protein [Candidatus Gastranaerophilales bacterium]